MPTLRRTVRRPFTPARVRHGLLCSSALVAAALALPAHAQLAALPRDGGDILGENPGTVIDSTAANGGVRLLGTTGEVVLTNVVIGNTSGSNPGGNVRPQDGYYQLSATGDAVATLRGSTRISSTQTIGGDGAAIFIDGADKGAATLTLDSGSHSFTGSDEGIRLRSTVGAATLVNTGSLSITAPNGIYATGGSVDLRLGQVDIQGNYGIRASAIAEGAVSVATQGGTIRALERGIMASVRGPSANVTVDLQGAILITNTNMGGFGLNLDYEGTGASDTGAITVTTSAGGTIDALGPARTTGNVGISADSDSGSGGVNLDIGAAIGSASFNLGIGISAGTAATSSGKVSISTTASITAVTGISSGSGAAAGNSIALGGDLTATRSAVIISRGIGAYDISIGEGVTVRGNRGNTGMGTIVTLGGSIDNSGMIRNGADESLGNGAAIQLGTSGGPLTITNRAGATIQGGSRAISLQGAATHAIDLQLGSRTIGDIVMAGSGANTLIIAGRLDGRFDASGTSADFVTLEATGSLAGASLGAGDDTFLYRGGDLAGRVDGGTGTDTLAIDVGDGITAQLDVTGFEILDQRSGIAAIGGAMASLTRIDIGSGIMDFLDGRNLTADIRVNGGSIRAGAAEAFGTGTIHLVDPTIQLSASGSYGNDIVLEAIDPVNDPSRILVDAGISAYLNGRISETGSQPLVIGGGGTLTLTNAANSWTGTTTIDAGTTLVSLAPGTLGPDGTTGIVNNGTLVFDWSGYGGHLSAISGSGALVKRGTGALTLAANNGYAGGTTLENGNLILGGSQALGAGALTLTGGMLQLRGYTQAASVLSGAGGTLLLQAGVLDVNQAGDSIYAGSIDFSGADYASTLNKRGTGALTLSGVLTGGLGTINLDGGALTLSGDNDFTGEVYLRAATLRLSGDNALGRADLFTSSSLGRIEAVGSLTLSNDLYLGGALGTQTVISVDDGETLSLAGQINGNRPIVKQGGGTLAFSRTNYMASNMLLQQGGIAVLANQALGTGSVTASDGTRLVLADGINVAQNGLILNGNLAVDVASGAAHISKAVSGSGSLTKTGNGTLYLDVQNSFTGGMHFNGGTTVLGVNATLAGYSPVDFNGGTLVMNRFGSILGPLSGTSGAIQLIDANYGLVIEQDADTRYAGTVGGAGFFAKQGSGTLTMAGEISGDDVRVRSIWGTLVLDAANSYGGGTEINNGSRLIVGNDAALGTGDLVAAILEAQLESNRSVTLANNIFIERNDSTYGNLAIGGDHDLTLTGTVAERGTGYGGVLIKRGGGTLTLAGHNSYTQGTVLERGTIVAGTDDAFGTGTVHVVGTGTIALGNGRVIANAIDLVRDSGQGYDGQLTVDVASGSAVLSGPIGGDGSLSVSGASLLLAGDLSYTGATTLRGGANLTLGGSGLVSGMLGPVTIDDGIFTVDRAGDVVIEQIDGAAGSFVKTGSGTTSLWREGSFTGDVTLANGTLKLSDPGAIAQARSVSLTGADTAIDLSVLDGFAAAATLHNLSGVAGSTIGLGYSGVLLIDNDRETEFAGTIRGTLDPAWVGRVFALGTGTLTLSGANDLREVDIENGTVKMAGAGTLGENAWVSMWDSTLDLSGVTGGQFAIGGLSGGPSTIVLGATTLTINNGGDIYEGTITGTGGLHLVSGWLGLTGAHDYTGETVIDADAALYTAAAQLASSVRVEGTLDISQYNFSSSFGGLNGKGTVSLGSNELILTGGGDFGGAIESESAGITLLAGRLNLSGTNYFGGSAGIAEGATIALIGNGSMENAIVDTNGTFDISAATVPVSLAGLYGSGTLALGNGQLTLRGDSEYSGTISGGTLAIASGTTLHLGGGASADGTQLEVRGALGLGLIEGDIGFAGLSGAGSISLGAHDLLSGGGTFDGTIDGLGGLRAQAGVVTLTGANFYTGATTVDAGATLRLDGGTLASDTIVANGVFDAAGAGAALTLASLGGTGSVQLGGHALTLTGASSFGGTISGSDTLSVLGGATLALTGSAAITGAPVVLGGTLDLRGTGGDTAIVDLTGNGSVLLGSHALVLGGNDGDTSFAGTISGGGGLTKTGTGTLTLSGANSYTGLTLVSAGTLRIGGVNVLADDSLLEVRDGATLDLNGYDEVVARFVIQGNLIGGGTLRANEYVLDGGIIDHALGGGLLDQRSGTTLLTGTAGALDVRVNGGTLRLGAHERLADTAALLIRSGGTLDLGAFDETVGTAGLAGTLAGSGTLTAGSYTLDGATILANLGAGEVVQHSGVSTLLGQASGSARIEGGTLRIGDGGTTGTLAGDIAVNGGILAFDRADAVTYAGSLSGGGTITQAGGLLTLAGDSGDFTGTMTVSGGLAVTGSFGGTGSTLRIDSGSLSGTGIIGGAVTLADGAHLVGAQGSTLSLGALTLGAGSIVDVTLARASTSALFDVAGNLTLDGTLNVTAVPGFGAGVYRLFDYGGTLTDNGMVLGAVAGSSTDRLSIQTGAAGRVNLVNNAGVALAFWDGGIVARHDNGAVEGGAGTWSLGGRNWTDANGSVNGAMTPQPSFAVFQGNGGTVTVDNSAGQVSALGMQFASGGYVLAGGAIALSGPSASIRVGDGSAAGAGITATIAVALTGNSTLVKDDLGTLVLAGANSYSGGTLVSAGMLVGDTRSLQGAIANNAALMFDMGRDGSYAGALTGSGMTTKAGQGILTLAGTSTTDWTVSGGGLMASSASLTGDVALAAGTGLTFDQAAAGTYAGSVSGSGTLTKSGALLTLSGDNAAFEGTVTLVSGGLTVTGTLGSASSTVTVASGTLEGTGTIGGAVKISDGAHLAGSQGGTLSLGALTLGSGGIVDVALSHASDSALFDVAGNLTLDGMLNVTAAPGFGAGIYRLFDYRGTLTDNGLVLGTVVGAATDALTIQTAVAGQVNLLNSAGATLAFWDGGNSVLHDNGAINGGSGSWDAGSRNWTDTGGTLNGPMQPVPSFAVFGGMAGTVTVDGHVSTTGMQFATTGYTVTGGTVALSGDRATIRVGDGSAAGAGFIATIGSALTGGAALVKTDRGTLVLTGANSYTGGTVIEAGTLVGDTRSIQGNVTNNASLVFDLANAGSYGGSVSGTGVTTKAGQGVLTLAGANAGDWRVTGGSLVSTTALFTGDVDLAAGTSLTFDQSAAGRYAGTLTGTGSLVLRGGGAVSLTGNSSGFQGITTAGGLVSVNGTLGGTLDLLAGGRLQGNGTIGSGRIAGTVAPGNSIGTLNVTGNLSFLAGSTYEVEANAAGQSDRIVVAGTASIQSGAVVRVLAAEGNYAVNTSYTILTAAGGLSGTFSNVTSNLAFLTPSLAYSANAVTLTLRRNMIDFAAVAQTRNQQGVAPAVEALGLGNPLHDAVVALAAPEARRAFDQLAGSDYASMRGRLIEDSRFVRDALLARGELAGEEGPAAWGTALGGWGSMRGGALAQGYDRDLKGLVAGFDAALGGHWRAGLATGYSTTDLRTGSATHKADSYHAGGYLAGGYGIASIQLGAAYAWNEVRSQRRIAFGGLAQGLGDRYRADTLQLFGEVAARADLRGVTLQPFAGLAHVRLGGAQIAEHGGSAALHGGTRDERMTYGTFGLRANTALDLGRTVLRFKGSTALRHAFGDTLPGVDFGFAAGPGFAVAGNALDRDSAAIDGGLELDLSRRVTLEISYAGNLGERTTDHGARAALRLRF
ncbi:autotransporter-associated beta strand repeat-containing protein [Sphingomonas sp. NIBR02145]|uniref:autotransporter-associated beta strand repeat-containing protein n=1 Tax=Sphingomonas sp. NIBR02145 TaxID=3014784 RepID=UPI0022B5581E|nr:autotransporter-associated beta strand repeat-containing protein [Sphingomonas sp. NIBR02145]WHU02387.1 autotransporter-associated beta strand repeat-containing protein [Sphingomonas sp. NIBR02145]